MNHPTAKLRQVLSVIGRVHSAHDAVNLEDLSEPALANRALAELHCRIVFEGHYTFLLIASTTFPMFSRRRRIAWASSASVIGSVL